MSLRKLSDLHCELRPTTPTQSLSTTTGVESFPFRAGLEDEITQGCVRYRTPKPGKRTGKQVKFRRENPLIGVVYTTVSGKKAASPACRDIRKLDSVHLAGPAPHCHERGGHPVSPTGGGGFERGVLVSVEASGGAVGSGRGPNVSAQISGLLRSGAARPVGLGAQPRELDWTNL